MTEAPAAGWQTLGALPSSNLVQARLQLHHAAQLVSAAGRSLLPARPDDSQTALEWLPGSGLFAGEWIDGKSRWRAALHPAGCALRLLDEAGGGAEYQLAGRPLGEGFLWLKAQAAARGSDPERLNRMVPYDVPTHPVGEGEPFRPDLAGCAELARYWGGAALLFEPLTRGVPEASAVRCWPHHFDIGFILGLEPRADDKPRTVGIGLSPGDESYGEPYFYVTLWPIPKASFYPPLPSGGNWHRKAWVGAVLTGFALTAHGRPDAQAARAASFLEAAIATARRLLA